MANAKDYLIAIDDGHDPSTAGKRTPPIPELGNRVIRENEFNKAVKLQLDKELRRCGFRTLLVAKGDDVTSLQTRVKRANDADADAYVSIHYNALDGKFDGNDPEGLSIHICPGSDRSRKLAEDVLKHLKTGTPQKNRGIVESNFYVLTKTKMVAILTENGFMDNKREAILMQDANFQKEVAREHAIGICDYFGVKYIPEEAKVEQPTYFKPYVVRVTVSALNVRETPTTKAKITKVVYGGNAFTIVDEKDGWGKLKSGLGWIFLKHTEKV